MKTDEERDEEITDRTIQCRVCDCETSYTGRTNVGTETKCTSCEHYLTGEHEIPSGAAYVGEGGFPEGLNFAPYFH
jgi:uncharacterized paraquat-inducible protein A